MSSRQRRQDAKIVADKYIARDGTAPRPYCEEALADVGAEPRDEETEKERMLDRLARLSELKYQQGRDEAAKLLGLRVTVLDKLVKDRRTKSDDADAELPHWKVKPWSEPVSTGALLDSIKSAFARHVILPPGAAEGLALWVLHAWTFDAGDVSPLMVLLSPTKRCGKTTVLIVLYYLTPRSELASNISPSAIFRYVEDTQPTLLIDEADSFLRENEEMRGILNSGHTKTAAHVIRTVEIGGEHKARRFSTWAPKALASIRGLADTLEDRAIIVQLQRKPPGVRVERLRKRDNEEFVTLRSKAVRWAADNFDKLSQDPDPEIPQALNDRAADNWRPLLAIADTAGSNWARRGREVACVLSGAGHESSSINVELLADIKKIFDADEETVAIRSIDLVTKLGEDLERPWADWSRGKPLSQKQLGGLLSDFRITSETVSIPGLKDAKGYKRVHFEEAWAAYLPGQNEPPPRSGTSKRRSVETSVVSAQVSDFRSVAPQDSDASKNCSLPNNGRHSDASTLPRVQVADTSGLDIPPFLKRPRLGPPAISSGPDDDLADLA